MMLEHLEERCRRYIELMQKGSAAIDRQDAVALKTVKVESEELLGQIERAWYMALHATHAMGDADLALLRELLAETIELSAQNQVRIRQRRDFSPVQMRIGPQQGTA